MVRLAPAVKPLLILVFLIGAVYWMFLTPQ